MFPGLCRFKITTSHVTGRGQQGCKSNITGPRVLIGCILRQVLVADHRWIFNTSAWCDRSVMIHMMEGFTNRFWKFYFWHVQSDAEVGNQCLPVVESWRVGSNQLLIWRTLFCGCRATSESAVRESMRLQDPSAVDFDVALVSSAENYYKGLQRSPVKWT